MSRLRKLVESLNRNAHSFCLEGAGFSYTYCDLTSEMQKWQDKFDAFNLKPGSVVGLCADYSLSAVAALLALWARQSISAIIPRDRSLDEYLTAANASILLQIDDDLKFRHRCLPEHSHAHPLVERLQAAGDPGLIIFTSGSTGRPKAALHDLERFLRKFDRPGRSLRTLAFLLFDHVAGLDTLLYTLWHGGTLILTRRRDPQSVLKLVASHRVEVLPTSPSFLRLACALPDRTSLDLTSLTVISYGSEPMDESTLHQVNACFPNAQVIQKYGTTETGSPRTASRGRDSLWLRFKDNEVQIKVIDGILWLRGGGTMLGYLNAPSPVTNDGWYCTGDFVEVDGGWIRFIGRSDQIIKVGGEKVALTEVENVIRELDFVRGVMVKGEPHPLMGAVVSARVVVPTSILETKEAAKHVRMHCRKRLAAHKVPVRIDIVFDDFVRLIGYRQKARLDFTEPNTDDDSLQN